MESSPGSTASSDLYPPSEPSNPAIPEELLQDPITDGEPQGISRVRDDDVQQSEYSDTMQGLESSGDEESKPSSIVPSPISNGIPLETSHKRKRDQDFGLGDSRQDVLASINPTQTISRTDDNRSTSMILSTSQIGIPSRDLWSSKRPKTGDHAMRPDVGAQLFSKSSALPAVLWQHILCYVPPVFLGNLLRVNHAFNSYLTPGIITEGRRKLPHSRIQPLTAEDIWAASRRRFAPGLPRPIHGFQELDMWRLLRGRDCQLCHQAKAAIPAADTDSSWESGPGYSGVRVIWPFGVRCCGECLQHESKKVLDTYGPSLDVAKRKLLNQSQELDIFLSSDFPSFLLPALPFAFVSDTNHYIAHNLLRSTSAPPAPYPSKRYYKPHLADIKRRCEDVKELGIASAEEWMKGLAGEGQKRLDDTIRWEQWESKGGLKKLNMPRQLKAVTSVGNKTSGIKAENHSDRSTPQSMLFTTKMETSQADQAPLYALGNGHRIPSTATPPLQQPWNCGVALQFGSQQVSQAPPYQSRPERSIQHVNEAKAARRAEIERRCAALKPPLLPNVLSHMESFQAAMQITQPMTDQAWQMLKPRLLAQLPYAERKEKERVQQNEVLEEKYREQRQLEARLKETKENSDREWETFQAPVRNRIGKLADEIIEYQWAGPSNITKDTSPKFAADVLLGVRQRFYAVIAEEDEAARAAGESVKVDPANSPPTRTLILENMKWLFDTKIKPLTDHFQRELFLCNGCDSNFKFYGFEGVIQHYAAKHTSELSRGNVVVNWRAEWPEDPPFNPNPSVVKAAYYKVPTPATPVPAPPPRDSQGIVNSGAYGQIGAAQAHDGAPYPTNMYHSSYTGSHQQTSHPLLAQSYPTSQPTYAPATGYSGYSAAQSGYTGNPAQYNPIPNAQHTPGTQTYSSSHPFQQTYPAFANGQPGPNMQGYFSGPVSNSYSGMPYPPNMSNGCLPHPVPNVPAQMPDIYQRQMDEMAKHAKDVFTGIGGVKDLPGNVRIFVVIQHTVSRFKAVFLNEPSLSMFIDGLDHNPVMRPVRSVNGLGCKTCIQSGTSVKLFTLPHLVNHFRTTHVEGSQALGYVASQDLDWKHDMIDLPDKKIISNLANAQGMTESKLSLIAWAFPAEFTPSLPTMRGKLNTGPLPAHREELDLTSRLIPAIMSNSTSDTSSRFQYPSNSQHYSGHDSEIRPPSEGASSGPAEPPGEDEYDPHRPAYLGKIVKIESDSSQSHKPAKSSTLQGGQQSSLQALHEPEQHRAHKHADGERTDNAFAPRNNVSESHTGQPYELTQYGRQPPSPRPNAMDRFTSRFDMRANEQGEPQLLEHLHEYEDSSDHQRRYRDAPKDVDDSFRPLLRGLRNASPPKTASAVDHFLSSLASKQNGTRSRDTYTADPETEKLSDAPWESEFAAVRRQTHSGVDGISDQRPANEINGQRQQNEPLPEHIRTGLAESGNGDHRVQRRFRSQSPYLDGRRSSSHIHIPLKSIRPDDDSIVRYVPYKTTSPSYVDDGEEIIGSTSKRPLSGTLPYNTERLSHYRHSPAAPQQSSPGTALYRPQSPVEENRHSPVYQVRSPPRRQERSQRIVRLDYPTRAQYEFVDDRPPQEDFQSRVHYIRYEDLGQRESTRYVVARPVEQTEPQYVRYERTYTDEPVYEQSGSIYHAPARRVYQDQPPRAAQTLQQGYEY